MPGPWFFLRASRSVAARMPEKLRLIQCGLGGMGKAWRDNATAASPDFEVVAIVDIADKELTAGGEQLDVPPERRVKEFPQGVRRAPPPAGPPPPPPPPHPQPP